MSDVRPIRTDELKKLATMYLANREELERARADLGRASALMTLQTNKLEEIASKMNAFVGDSIQIRHILVERTLVTVDYMKGIRVAEVIT